ncbi:class II 3-deoxy-7-phosphoheptulonate synthase [Actinokineospora sp. G85]|uniref:class II 3-deoxy-7-phosphoheptulonate synthase n=1 Tax=Actinokineospora sp. G85 TaxID=3406626 RepID=UPI003C7294F1
MHPELLDTTHTTWRARPAAHQPGWPDPAPLADVLDRLRVAPGVVTPAGCDDLRSRLAEVAAGRAFVLQGGDCAETFAGVRSDSVRDKLKTLLQMAVVLTYAGSVPVVKIGRMAGQYAKPRSSPVETLDGATLPVYLGDAVNGFAFDAATRTPDPRRLWQAYEASRATMAMVDDYAHNGYAGLDQLHRWNRDFVASSPAGERYEEVALEIDRALRFMRACGAHTDELRSVNVFASHEGLLLDYEDALTRPGPGGASYATSGHMLWIGERTRALNGAHVAFFRSIANPIAVKVGPNTTINEVCAYVEQLNPDGIAGRLTFITRMGASTIRDRLPDLITAIRDAGPPVAWVCDPMHGNTIKSNGIKTRALPDVLDEVRGFFEVHRTLGTHPGGLHVEFTGEDVTECLGGTAEIRPDDLPTRYESVCDPRLNRSQSLDLAFLVAELL